MAVEFELRQAFREVVSPAYIFSAQAFASRAKMVKEAFGDRTDICFSIKANPFLLSVLPDEFSKIEVCSPGELEICKALHIDPAKIIFSGVNKSQAEVDTAVDYGVRILTAESENHLRYISKAASERGITAEVLLRLSCESQFGMDKSDIFRIVADRGLYPGTDIKGIHYFTGTQKTRPKEIIKEITRLNKLIDRLEEELDFRTERIEYGTGLAVDYFAEDADDKEAARLSEISECIRELSKRVELTVEMGRFFAAPCGWLVNTVADTKFNDGTHYAILDGGLHKFFEHRGPGQGKDHRQQGATAGSGRCVYHAIPPGFIRFDRIPPGRPRAPFRGWRADPGRSPGGGRGRGAGQRDGRWRYTTHRPGRPIGRADG